MKSAGVLTALLGLACAGGVESFAMHQGHVGNTLQGVRRNKNSSWQDVETPLNKVPSVIPSSFSGERTDTSLQMSLGLRGGAASASSLISSAISSPTGLFNSCLVGLGLTTAVLQLIGRSPGSKEDAAKAKAQKPTIIRSLQRRFLAVFWLLRCADWLQGPYFYEVYASKIINGAPATASWISRLFLTGFASTAFFGPFIGRVADERGRKLGTILFCALYSVGAASTASAILPILFLGRIFSGIGTSLLFSAPESWLVAEAQKKETGDEDGKYLGETFGLVSQSYFIQFEIVYFYMCFFFLRIFADTLILNTSLHLKKNIYG